MIFNECKGEPLKNRLVEMNNGSKTVAAELVDGKTKGSGWATAALMALVIVTGIALVLTGLPILRSGQDNLVMAWLEAAGISAVSTLLAMTVIRWRA